MGVKNLASVAAAGAKLTRMETETSVDPQVSLVGPVRSTAQRRRMGAVALLVVVVVGVAAASWWAGTRVSTPAQQALAVAPPTPVIVTLPVVEKRLVERMPASGALQARGVVSVNLPTSAPPGAVAIVTRPLMSAGSPVAGGTQLAEVAGRPTFTFEGSTPMYRDLSRGDEGRDVAQLAVGLADLGYSSHDPATQFGASLESAVKQFFADKGYPFPAGVTSIVVSQEAVVFLPHLPAVVAGNTAVVGQPVVNPAMTVAYGAPEALVDLTQAQSILVTVGDQVLVTGTVGSKSWTAAGVVASVGPGQTPSTPGAAGGPAFAAHVTFRGVVPAGAQRPVSVSITTAQSSGVVLAVPISSVFTTSDGSTAVSIPGGSRPQTVTFDPGKTIAGEVEVISSSVKLKPGDPVIINATQG